MVINYMIDVSKLNGKSVKGVVVSDKVDQAIIIKVEYQKKDSRFHKVVFRSKKIMAHDPDNKAKIGDFVKIRECRPLSRRKRFILESIL